MAIIYSYPLKTTPKPTDLLVISDMESTSPNFQTKQVSIQSVMDLLPIAFAPNAWSKLHVTNTIVPQSDIVAVGVDQAWTIAPADSSIELTSDPATSTLFVRAIGDGFDNISNADLIFNANHVADLQDAVGAPNYTWQITNGSSPGWKLNVMYFSENLLSVGDLTPINPASQRYMGAWQIPINENLKGRDNVYLGGGALPEGIPANEDWSSSINSNHEFITKSTSVGIGALAFAGLIGYYGGVTFVNIVAPGTGYTPGIYTNVPISSPTGSGLEISYTIDGAGQLTSIDAIDAPGEDYINGEVINLPGGNNDAQIGVLANSDENNEEATAIGHTSQYNFGQAISTPGTDQVGQNTSLGYRSLFSNTGGSGVDTGSFNVAIGGRALELLDFGDRNTAIGHNVGNALTLGYQNVLVGMEVGLAQSLSVNPLTTGASNVIIGHYADNDNNDSNVVIGESAYLLGGVLSNTALNTINIGAAGFAKGDFAINIGSNSISPFATAFDGGYTWIGHNGEYGTASIGINDALFSTHVGNSSVVYGYANDTFGDGINLGDIANFENYENVLIGNYSTMTTGNFQNVGVGVNGLFFDNVNNSVGLGEGYAIFQDHTFVVELNSGLGIPDVNFHCWAGGSGPAGYVSNLWLKGDFEISGKGDLVTPYELSLDFENTRFTGQTELAMEEVIPNPGPAVTQLDFNNGDMTTIYCNNAASCVLEWPQNIKDGTYIIKVKQGGPPGYVNTVLTFNNNSATEQWKFPGGIVPLTTNAADAEDIITIVSTQETGTGEVSLYTIMAQNFLP